MHLTITPTHAPNYHTHHSVRRHTTMLRLGYFVALFVAPAAALSGETVVGLASSALRLSRRALQDLPSIPGMPSISGLPSIPGMSMDPSALISQMDLTSLLRVQQLLYCNSDQAKVIRHCCGPLSQSPGPDPPGLPAQAHPAHLGRHLASPRAALPHASWGSSKSSTARWLRSWTRPPPRRCPTRSCSSSACARAAGTSATRRSTASSASSAAGTWNPPRCSTRSR